MQQFIPVCVCVYIYFSLSLFLPLNIFINTFALHEQIEIWDINYL